MNRLVGFALVVGFLASSAAASAAGTNQAAPDRSAHLAAPAVQQPLASVEQSLPGLVAPLAPSNTTRRTIHASQPGTSTALPSATVELAPASPASLGSCPPARTEVACRKP